MSPSSEQSRYFDRRTRKCQDNCVLFLALQTFNFNRVTMPHSIQVNKWVSANDPGFTAWSQSGLAIERFHLTPPQVNSGCTLSKSTNIRESHKQMVYCISSNSLSKLKQKPLLKVNLTKKDVKQGVSSYFVSMSIQTFSLET